MKTKSILPIVLLAFVPASPSAAEAELVSGASICTEYNKDGSVNAGGFSGGDGMANLFDKNFNYGVHFGRSADGSYFVLDLTQKLAGGYFIDEIKIGEVGGFQYSVYYSTDGSNWSGVENAVSVVKIGTSSFKPGLIATHIKVVMDKSPGSGAGLSEIQVWGIDPATMRCVHPTYTEWEAIDGTATCTEPGVDRRKCSVCGDVFERSSELLPPLGHVYVETLTSAGTSSRYGSGTIGCERCDWATVFINPVDLASLGGVSTHFLVQFTDLTVSSTGNMGWGCNPKKLVDGIWTFYEWSDWHAESRSHDEWIQFDFGTEIDLTEIKLASADHKQTVEFYKVKDGEEIPIGEVILPGTTNNDENTQSGSIAFRGVSLKTLRVRISDSIGLGVNGIRPVCLGEIHPWGTVKGAGKLDVLRSKILLY